MSLSTSRLAIGKTCCHAAFKNGLDQRFSCEPEDNNSVNEKYTVCLVVTNMTEQIPVYKMLLLNTFL